jgi:prophage antirepressor-like protein
MARKKDETSTDRSIVIFEDQPVRRVWNKKDKKWYFPIIDVIKVLTDSTDPSGYLKDMRRRDGELSKGWGQIATPLYAQTKGGRQKVNCANVEGTLRLIQSVPSKKAEPFKLWLAKVGYERLQETVDPEQSIIRARRNWQTRGLSEKWIEQRMRGQETRNKLTDHWNTHGVKEGIEYAKLTDVIHKEWSGLSTSQHKKLKGLKNHNLRDNMTEAELIFVALAELSTTQIAKAENADGYPQNKIAAKKGGSIAKGARQQLEQQTGKRVVSSENFLPGGEIGKRKQLE